MSRPRNPIGTYGTIKLDELDAGKWRARARYRFDDGKLRQVERFGTSEAKAKAALKNALIDIETPTESELTGATRLRVLAQKFLKAKESSDVTARTVDTYRWVIDTVVAPEKGNTGIGELAIREATTERLDRFLTAVIAERGKGTAKTCRSVLSGMMGLAVRSGAARINPVREVGAISRRNVGATQIDTDAMAGILKLVKASEPLRTLDLSDLIEFLAGTGARISEALALQWDQIDTEHATVGIIRNVVRAKGKGLILQPHTKTQAGMRKIAVPSRVINMLELRQRTSDNELDLVFPSQLGKLRDPNNTLRDWRLNRDSVDAPDTTFHSFRKYVATTLDAAGLSARDIAEYLGHARPSLTQDVYMSKRVGGSKAAKALNEALP